MPQSIGKVIPRHLTLATLNRRIEECEARQRAKEQQSSQEAVMLLITGDFDQLAGESMETLNREKKKILTDERRYRTEIHSRFSMAVGCLFFTLVGGPFSMLQARRQFITSFILCFLPILIIYYPVMFLMVNLCKMGTVEPWWAMWVPNMILGAVGTIVLRKVVQH
jgi:lipopolysaccharide export system permease protein